MPTKKKPCKTCPGGVRQAQPLSAERLNTTLEITNPTEVEYIGTLSEPKLVIGVTGNHYVVTPESRIIVVSESDASGFDKVIRKSEKNWRVIGPAKKATTRKTKETLSDSVKKEEIKEEKDGD